MSETNTQTPVRSPCVGICALDNDDLCVACHRSGLEIADWGAMSDDEKRAVWALIRRREQGERGI
ncbi:hypothetical protein ADIMK_0656 [Marinobacterium lacunae]|uniref:DUF1289 domain-containing protein n=1 Tax=Marinobacterium lacunae TaxID=1232683 RepID=A0A081G2E9_9GAMM|nr:DUF1289 domain-containing protein [Marinobacterium lacunae]KEA64954.1 hypothetical protein ADIMK_0656 [Marinobacterium lacunae]MBR9882282.1 DUF1289 domain-containing protein [Oceanospirillales bacterium]